MSAVVLLADGFVTRHIFVFHTVVFYHPPQVSVGDSDG